jgi:hypothetical protein
MGNQVERFPRSRIGNYSATRYNARKHGVLSTCMVLPWEDPEAYRRLHVALFAEHRPQGATEVHLVESIAWVIWRLDRVRNAEIAAHSRALAKVMADSAVGPDKTASAALAHVVLDVAGHETALAVSATDEQNRGEQAELEKTRNSIAEAICLLDQDSSDADHALQVLTSEVKAEWRERESPPSCLAERIRMASPVAYRMREFLKEMQLKIRERQNGLDHRSRIRNQAFSEAVLTCDLEPLARYETHLDRMLGRHLTMLIRLQQLRGGRGHGESVSR